ncbi:MAG: glycerol-3-phosphate 1-O-acyltransferase PlsY [Tissierellia bacterium]|nr:glycerol-3-phosphate 1-O-acyltransferase PlsY [Tissierellia bacterium]
MANIIILILSYLIGSVSGSFILGRFAMGIDIRKKGSGNAGTTNAIRVMGVKFGALTFFIDFLKGVIAIAIVSKLSKDLLVPASLCCILGHDFPFYMNFKGGKGVATTVGCMTMIDIRLGALLGIIWAIGILLTKIVSIGSILLFICLTPLYLFLGHSQYLFIIIIIGVLGIYRHQSNIIRLKNKQEPKIGGKK